MASSSAPTVNIPIYDAQKEARNRLNYQHYPTANTPSSLTEEDISDFHEIHQIPLQYQIRAPFPEERIYWQPEGYWIAVPTWTLKNGVRFPLHPFISEFLSFLGIGFSQLVPNAYIHLICFIAHCHDQGVKPALDLFFNYFKLINSKEKGFKVLSRYASRKTWMSPPSSNKGWHSSWFFLRGEDTHLIPSWGEPSKNSLGFSEVEGVRENDLKKLLQTMPETPWPLSLLSNRKWLYKHGLVLFLEENRTSPPEDQPEPRLSHHFIASDSESTESESPDQPLTRKPKTKNTTEPSAPQPSESPSTKKPSRFKHIGNKPKRTKKTTKIIPDSDSPSSPIPETQQETPPEPTFPEPSPTAEPHPNQPPEVTSADLASETTSTQPPLETSTSQPAPQTLKRNALEMSAKEKQKLMKAKRPRIERPPTKDIPIPPFQPIPEQPSTTPQHTKPLSPEKHSSPILTQSAIPPEPTSKPPEIPESFTKHTEQDPFPNDHPPQRPNFTEAPQKPPTFWQEDMNGPLPFKAFSSFIFGADDMFEDYSDRELIYATAVNQGRALASFGRLLNRQIKGEGADKKLKELKAKNKALRKKKKQIATENASLQSTNNTLQQQIDALFESTHQQNQLHQKIAELTKKLEEKDNQHQLLQQQNDELLAEVQRQDNALKTAFEDSEALRKSNDELREQAQTGTPELRQQILNDYQTSRELADRIVEQFAEGFEAAIQKAVKAGVNPDIFYSDDDAPEE